MMSSAGLVGKSPRQPTRVARHYNPSRCRSGRVGRVCSGFRNLLLVQLKSNRLLFVTDDEGLTKSIKDGFSALSHVEFCSPDALPYHTTRIASGRTVILVLPGKGFESVEARGIVDGGIARLLAGRLWRKLVVVREREGCSGFNQGIPSPPTANCRTCQCYRRTLNPATWLVELSLSLLYRRHLTAQQLIRILPYSIWWHRFQLQDTPIDETLRKLVKENLVKKEKGRYTCIVKECCWSNAKSRIRK